MTYVQDPGLKVTGTVSARFMNSPITRSLKTTLAADAPEALVRGGTHK